MMGRALRLASAGALLLLAACSPTMVDIRPFVAHADQKLETEDTIVSVQHRIRTSSHCMTEKELYEEFRVPGKEGRDGNPFLYKPPLATTRYMVFRLQIHNQSEYTSVVEFAKIRLLDDLSNEYRPVSREELLNYWMGRVTIRLKKPITWSDQMASVRRTYQKEKSLYQAVYAGGILPPKGEHIGFVAFKDIKTQARRLQLLVEIVTRTSRYGNPLNVALLEFNFNRVRVPVSPRYLQPEDVEGWR